MEFNGAHDRVITCGKSRSAFGFEPIHAFIRRVIAKVFAIGGGERITFLIGRKMSGEIGTCSRNSILGLFSHLHITAVIVEVEVSTVFGHHANNVTLAVHGHFNVFLIIEFIDFFHKLSIVEVGRRAQNGLEGNT